LVFGIFVFVVVRKRCLDFFSPVFFVVVSVVVFDPFGVSLQVSLSDCSLSFILLIVAGVVPNGSWVPMINLIAVIFLPMFIQPLMRS
jgi:hypothetical protein